MMPENKVTMAVGIDIGKEGAIAILKKDGTHVISFKMPMIKTEVDYHELYRLIDMYGGESHIVFERLGVIFGSSKVTALSMGHQGGAVEMACIAKKASYTKVPPKDWQKEMFQGLDAIHRPLKAGQKKATLDTKAMALVAVKRLFPQVKLTFGDKAVKPHDGLVDAILMSEYCRRNFL